MPDEDAGTPLAGAPPPAQPPTVPPSPPSAAVFSVDDDDEFDDEGGGWEKHMNDRPAMGGADLDAEFDAEFDEERQVDEAQRGLGLASVKSERSMPVWLQGTPIAKHSSTHVDEPAAPSATVAPKASSGPTPGLAAAPSSSTASNDWDFHGGTAVSNLLGGPRSVPKSSRRDVVDLNASLSS